MMEPTYTNAVVDEIKAGWQEGLHWTRFRPWDATEDGLYVKARRCSRRGHGRREATHVSYGGGLGYVVACADCAADVNGGRS